MALDEFLVELDGLTDSATESLNAALDVDSLEAVRIDLLGAKSGRLKALQKGLAAIDSAEKPVAGKRFNEAKQKIEAAYAAAKERLTFAVAQQSAAGFDPTEPGCKPILGHLHPITQTIEELKDIFARLGFSVADGPEIEDERHNFEALNIARSHPARDPLDNFYLQTATKSAGPERSEWLLRSQTSTVQIRVMDETPPPVRIVSLGRVYRPDTADATHYPMFHQIEGLLVDTDVTMADLKSVLRMFCSSYLGEDVHVRFRPSFFPFTEPSVEVDMRWQDGWIEMGGAGMVDPNVFEAVGYDPEKVTGFAFGLGVERLCARRYGITDIREFFKNDVRFLHQF
ncbi:MAG TPA: phenylalanine--tRNA ligase subunit alpha [Pirellulales bacterium]|nr:phenylalanine--tRNA ligase subunit alpha [Pirellulales bacterium]